MGENCMPNRCYVCDKTCQDDWSFFSFEKTSSSQKSFPDLISSVVGECYTVIVSDEDIICSDCVSLINEFAYLEEKLLVVKTKIVKHLTTKYNLDEGENIENSANDSTDELLSLQETSSLDQEDTYVSGSFNIVKIVKKQTGSSEKFQDQCTDSSLQDSNPETVITIDARRKKQSSQPKSATNNLCLRRIKTEKCEEANTSIKKKKENHQKQIINQPKLRPILPKGTVTYNFVPVMDEPKTTKDNTNKENQNKKLVVFHCFVCNTDFNNADVLASHKQLHKQGGPNTISCSYCGKVFKSRSGVIKHTIQYHTRNYPFHCDICGKGFADKCNYNAHRNTHMQKAIHSCDICGKTFVHSASMWIHRKWHTNPRPYKCQYCGKMFKHSSALACHRRAHTGERPYKCKFCERSFIRGSELRKHTITHTKIYPFNCNICHKGYSVRSRYADHMEKVHDRFISRPTVDKKNFKMAIPEEEYLEQESPATPIPNDNVVTSSDLDSAVQTILVPSNSTQYEDLVSNIFVSIN